MVKSDGSTVVIPDVFPYAFFSSFKHKHRECVFVAIHFKSFFPGVKKNAHFICHFTGTTGTVSCGGKMRKREKNC